MDVAQVNKRQVISDERNNNVKERKEKDFLRGITFLFNRSVTPYCVIDGNKQGMR